MPQIPHSPKMDWSKTESLKIEKYANCRGAKLIEVVAVEVNEGKGIAGDPVRRVLYLYSKDGKLLAQTKDEDRLFKENDFMILK